VDEASDDFSAGFVSCAEEALAGLAVEELLAFGLLGSSVEEV